MAVSGCPDGPTAKAATSPMTTTADRARVDVTVRYTPAARNDLQQRASTIEPSCSRSCAGSGDRSRSVHGDRQAGDAGAISRACGRDESIRSTGSSTGQGGQNAVASIGANHISRALDPPDDPTIHRGLHQIHQPSGLREPDPQPALQHRRRTQLRGHHQIGGRDGARSSREWCHLGRIRHVRPRVHSCYNVCPQLTPLTGAPRGTRWRPAVRRSGRPSLPHPASCDPGR